jgi:hypothetical protein
MSPLFRTVSAESKPVSISGIVVPWPIARRFARFWILTVIVGSLLPGSLKVALHATENKRTHPSSTVDTKHRVDTNHRFVHIFAFGSSFLVLSVLATRRREELEVAAEILVIGCFVELAQYYFYSHRQVFEWWDVRDDAIGIAVAFLFLQIASCVSESIASKRST